VRQALDESLTRLGTDGIDLYQLHVPDPTVPIAETLGALDDLVRAGKVREIGCSNLSADELDTAMAEAHERGLRPFASIQSPLNLVQRGALTDIMPACERNGIAFIPYYPLASGVLTGKYRRGKAAPEDSRIGQQVTADEQARILSDRTFARLDALTAFAAAQGHTLLELAFGWLLGHPAVATIIAGASKPGQAAVNADAAGWTLTPDEVAEATRVVQNAVS
jgi:aryl-alcohol dehydrogenase-like predicted oxidoreductase